MNFRTALSFEIDSRKYTYNIELDEFRSILQALSSVS